MRPEILFWTVIDHRLDRPVHPCAVGFDIIAGEVVQRGLYDELITFAILQSDLVEGHHGGAGHLCKLGSGCQRSRCAAEERGENDISIIKILIRCKPGGVAFLQAFDHSAYIVGFDKLVTHLGAVMNDECIEQRVVCLLVDCVVFIHEVSDKAAAHLERGEVPGEQDDALVFRHGFIEVLTTLDLAQLEQGVVFLEPGDTGFEDRDSQALERLFVQGVDSVIVQVRIGLFQVDAGDTSARLHCAVHQHAECSAECMYH